MGIDDGGDGPLGVVMRSRTIGLSPRPAPVFRTGSPVWFGGRISGYDVGYGHDDYRNCDMFEYVGHAVSEEGPFAERPVGRAHH